MVRGALGRVQRAELVAPFEGDGHVVPVLDERAQVVDAQGVALDVAVDLRGRGSGGGGGGVGGGGGGADAGRRDDDGGGRVVVMGAGVAAGVG